MNNAHGAAARLVVTTPEEAAELHEKAEAKRLLRAEQAEAALKCLEIIEAELRYIWSKSHIGAGPVKLSQSIEVATTFFRIRKSEGKTLLDVLKQVASALACDQAARKAATSARAETAERMRAELGT